MRKRIVVPLVGVSALLTVALAPVAANATQGQPVLAGMSNTASSVTRVENTSSGGGMYVLARGQGHGIVSGGFGTNSAGVYGFSVLSNGVLGTAGTSGTNGVMGSSPNSFASGVYGENSSRGYGVAGRSGGIALLGDSTGSYGIGVQGNNYQQGGIGVYAAAGDPSGTGLYATNPTGVGLSVNGRAKFSTSGRVTVPAGSQTVTATGITLTADSLVMVTPQFRQAGVFVEAAVPNVAASSFTVYLNKAVNSATDVAWFIVN